MRAFIFPGQGAQTIGMGKALADAYPAAAEVFARVDDALSEKLSLTIWDGDIETLTLTENAQPALMATSLAAMAALEVEGILVDGAAFVAGHSLGEYSALAAAKSVSLEDTARLLRTRGKAMQAAVPVGEGAMAAVLGLDLAAVEALAKDASSANEIVVAANDNDPAQVVISGHNSAVERAAKAAKDAGAKRALMLPVSAPFHSPLMQPAAVVMAQALSEVDVKDPVVPLVANTCAHGVTSGQVVRNGLVDQVTASVRWRESVAWMVDQGVTEFVEVGAGKALSGMVRRIAKGAALGHGGNHRLGRGPV